MASDAGPEAAPITEGTEEEAKSPYEKKGDGDETPKGWVYTGLEALVESTPSIPILLTAERTVMASFPYNVKLSYLVLYQQPPRQRHFINNNHSVFLQDESSNGFWLSDYQDRSYFTPDVIKFLSPIGMLLMCIPIPIVLGVQPREGENIDLRSTSIAGESKPFSTFTVGSTFKPVRPKPGDFAEIPVKDLLTPDCTFFETGVLDYSAKGKILSGTAKLKDIEAVSRDYTAALSVSPIILNQNVDTQYYWCNQQYLDEVAIRFNAYNLLFDKSPERAHQVMRHMGLRMANYSLVPTPMVGSFKGEWRYALPQRFPRPYVHEHKYITDNTALKVASTGNVLGTFSPSSEPRMTIVATKSPGTNSVLSAFTETAGSSAILRQIIFKYFVEGFAIKPIFTRKLPNDRLVMEMGLYMLLIPPFGTGKRFHMDMCSSLKTQLSITEDSVYSSIRMLDRPAAWNTEELKVYWAYLHAMTLFSWTAITVRAYVTDRVSIVYVPTIIIDTHNEARGGLPFGPSSIEQVPKLGKIITKVSAYYAQFSAAVLSFVKSFTRHGGGNQPFTGTPFCIEFIRSEVNFYYQVLAAAETHWDTRMPWESEYYSATMTMNINPFCLLVYPNAEGETLVTDIETINANEFPKPLEPIDMYTYLQSEHDVNMIELVHLIGLWSFSKRFEEEVEVHAFVATFLLCQLVGTCNGKIFNSEQAFFTPEQVKQMPSPTLASIPTQLKPFYDYFLFMAKWQMSPEGTGIYTHYESGLKLLDQRINLGTPPVSTSTNLLLANRILQWTKPARKPDFFNLSLPAGAVKAQTAVQVTERIPGFLTGFKIDELIDRLGGLEVGEPVAPTTTHVLLKCATWCSKLSVCANKVEVQTIETVAMPKIIKTVLGGYEFSAVDVAYPLVPYVGKGSLFPPIRVRMTQCDDGGRPLRPIIRVQMDGYNLVIEDDSKQTTMRDVFAKGNIIAAPYRVKIYTTLYKMPPLIPITVRTPLALMAPFGR